MTSSFNDLQMAYGVWHQARSDYRMASFQFLRQFSEAFRKYIGAPEAYSNDDQAKSRKPYVELLAVSEDEEGNYTFTASRSPFEVLSQRPDGFWETGIGLVVDRNANTFPKAEFAYPIRFVLRDAECEMIFPENRRFTFAPNKIEDQTTIFDYMVGVVEELLSMRPWETTEKRPIGFMPLNGQP